MSQSMTVDQAKASIRQLEKICLIRPTVENLSKLSLCYFLLEDLESAIPLAETAFQKAPHNPIVMANLAVMWKDYGDHEGAHKLLKIAVEELESEDQFVKLAWAESLLRKGSWAQAWPFYESARPSKEDSATIAGIPLQVKEWAGIGQLVKKLAVVDEGGFGDSITFSRYLPMLSGRGIDWIYLPVPELRGFYERASWCGKERLAQTGGKMDISHWTTVSSLPAALESRPLIVPKHKEPFKPLSKFIEKYKLRNRKPTLGLCWNAGERKAGRKVQSMTEGQAMRLVCKTDHLVDWVNLQYDYKMPEPVTNVKFSTWEELAGLIYNLDAVVSVATGPMCLAHAMEKKTIILLSGNSDWRFLDSGPSPFYPEATLFRNAVSGIEKAITDAIEFVNTNWDDKKRLVVVG